MCLLYTVTICTITQWSHPVCSRLEHLFHLNPDPNKWGWTRIGLEGGGEVKSTNDSWALHTAADHSPTGRVELRHITGTLFVW